jgi:hypothetical protein
VTLQNCRGLKRKDERQQRAIGLVFLFFLGYSFSLDFFEKSFVEGIVSGFEE